MVLYITYIFGFLEPFSAFLLVKENSIYQSKVVVPVCNLSNPDPTLGKDRDPKSKVRWLQNVEAFFCSPNPSKELDPASVYICLGEKLIVERLSVPKITQTNASFVRDKVRAATSFFKAKLFTLFY